MRPYSYPYYTLHQLTSIFFLYSVANSIQYIRMSNVKIYSHYTFPMGSAFFEFCQRNDQYSIFGHWNHGHYEIEGLNEFQFWMSIGI